MLIIRIPGYGHQLLHQFVPLVIVPNVLSNTCRKIRMDSQGFVMISAVLSKYIVIQYQVTNGECPDSVIYEFLSLRLYQICL